MVGMADAMAFAELSGLDLEKTRQMILGGTGKSGAMESLAPKALDGDYKPGFMVEHFIKDLRLALAYADARELALPGADVAFMYDKLVPDLRMLSLLKTKEGIVPELSQETYKTIWARITKAFSGIQKHFFYRRIPYEVLEERTRPSLKTLAAEMKVRYMPKLMNYKNCERVYKACAGGVQRKYPSDLP